VDLVHAAAVMFSTAAPARLRLVAVLAALAAACAIASTAAGAGNAWSAYLAPVGACKGSTDAAASALVQQRAVRCLVNWARARHRERGLAPSRSLRRAALLKGRGVVSCRQISHTPCGSDVAAPVRAAGYAYASFAENLYVGSLGSASARDVVSAWLQSPGHRLNILNPGFRDVGTALVRADGVFYEGAAVVWIAAFASPR
jgi:uncharacterized protein YkwD